MHDDLLASIPDSQFTSVVDVLLAGCAPHLRAHCERSFQFAALLARAEGVELDEEVLYLGTILHDVGLAPLGAGTARFEPRGADLVRTTLFDAGFDRGRAEAVWDVIALHATSTLARHKSAETSYANRGISIDVRGTGAEPIDPAAVRAVLDRWPRHEFPQLFSATMVAEVQANPETARFCFMESIAVAHVPGYRSGDFLAGLAASAHFV